MGKSARPPGRPRIELDPKQFYQAGMRRMSFEDMAAVLGVSRDTVDRRRDEDPECDVQYQKGRAERRSRLQGALDEAAFSGACWPALRLLVTNELGYSLKETVEHTGTMTAKYIVEVPAPMPMEVWQATYSQGDDPNDATVQ
jgi:hypothetical protein